MKRVFVLVPFAFQKKVYAILTSMLQFCDILDYNI